MRCARRALRVLVRAYCVLQSNNLMHLLKLAALARRERIRVHLTLAQFLGVLRDARAESLRRAFTRVRARRSRRTFICGRCRRGVLG